MSPVLYVKLHMLKKVLYCNACWLGGALNQQTKTNEATFSLKSGSSITNSTCNGNSIVLGNDLQCNEVGAFLFYKLIWHISQKDRLGRRLITWNIFFLPHYLVKVSARHTNISTHLYTHTHVLICTHTEFLCLSLCCLNLFKQGGIFDLKTFPLEGIRFNERKCSKHLENFNPPQ